jgi:hypothetical protein
MYLTDSGLGVVSFDLDSTLCCTEHRKPMIVEGFNDWAAYSLACVNDSDGPALPMAQYLSSIGAPLVVCSARDEVARPQTMKWLHDRGVNPWMVVLNRGEETGHIHGKWKVQQLLRIEKILGRKIVAHFDDHSSVAEATEPVGIKTILVHETNKLGEFLG